LPKAPSMPQISRPQVKARPSPVSGFRQTAGRFQQIRADRARGISTPGTRRSLNRISSGAGRARSGLKKGGGYLRSVKDYAHRHRMTSKSKGGRSPGEMLGSELRKGANNAPLIGTKARKKGIRNQ